VNGPEKTELSRFDLILTLALLRMRRNGPLVLKRFQSSISLRLYCFEKIVRGQRSPTIDAKKNAATLE
jgi:hypothetical protein